MNGPNQIVITRAATGSCQRAHVGKSGDETVQNKIGTNALVQASDSGDKAGREIWISKRVIMCRVM